MRFKQTKIKGSDPLHCHCNLYNCGSRFLTIVLSIQLVSGIATPNVFQSEIETAGANVVNSSGSVSNVISSTGTSTPTPTPPSTASLLNDTENVNRDNGNNGGGSIRVDNDVQNISKWRPGKSLFIPKNVSRGDFTGNLTETGSEEFKESGRRDENNTQANTDTSLTWTRVKTELHGDTNTTNTTKNTDDGVAAVNQSAVSTTVTNSKTETETNRGEEESSTLLVLRLAQCRANCLSKKTEKLRRNQKYSVYSKKMNVYATKTSKEIGQSYSECWDTCLLLEIENGENHPSKLADVVCSLNNSTCLSGCQDACEFHHYVQHVAKNGTKPPLLAATKVESFLSYNLSTSPSTRRKGAGGSGFQLDLRWPESDGYLVYSVVQHVRLKNTRLGWTWRLLEQTTMGKISLTFSEKPKIENIRVLAASPVHLVHVFSREKPGGGDGGGGMEPKPRSDHHNSEVGRGSLLKSEDEQKQSTADSWHLRKVSMVHQKFLVVTEISWDLPENKSHVEASFSSARLHANAKDKSKKEGNDTQRNDALEEAVASGFTQKENSSSSSNNNNNKSKHSHNFLLTWEVSGGILKGNMVTECDRRCDVTISLWPDTIYSIQVGLIEEKTNGSESRPLNPWEFEGEPKVTMKSSFLSVNTSDAVYLNPSVENNESDIQSDSSSSVLHSASSSTATAHQPMDTSSKKVEPISSFSRIQQAAAASQVVSIRENSKNLTTNHELKCDSSSKPLNWLCPSISIADVLFFCSTYGLLLIFFMMFCLWNSCQRYFYNYNQFVSHLRLNSDKKCKLALLRDPQENIDHFPEITDPGLRKQALANLMEYNIV